MNETELHCTVVVFLFLFSQVLVGSCNFLMEILKWPFIACFPSVM